MTADTPPAEACLTVDLHPFECGPAVRTREAPSHFPYTGGAFDGLDTQLLGPRRSGIGTPAFAGGIEIISNDRPKDGSLVLRQAAPVSLKGARKFEPQPWSGVRDAVKVCEERIGAIENDNAAGRDVLIGLLLHGLPALAPEPVLVGWHRQ